MSGGYRVGPLDPGTDRSGFASGVEPLDRYFRTQVSQDIRRRVTACFVALDANDRVAGYYTLASASILLSDLAPGLAKKLPRYPHIPAVRMGRIGVDQGFRGRGLGAALLADSLRRSLNNEIAAYAFLVDAIDDAAAAFYLHHGFVTTTESDRFLYLPLATARALLDS